MEYERKSIEKENRLVFQHTVTNLYVLEVDYDNSVLQYTDNLEEALTIPNTTRYKNTRKYETLIDNKELKVLNLIKKVEYVTEIKGN